MKAEELLEKCEGEIKRIKRKFWCSSYSSEFKDIRKTFFENIDEDEVDLFIDICNNRLDRAKTFLGHTATSLSIFIASLIILASILMAAGIKEGFKYILLDVLKSLGWHSQILAVLLLILAAFLVLLVGHYRTETHAWYVFKEGVLLMKKKKD